MVRLMLTQAFPKLPVKMTVFSTSAGEFLEPP
jgi:hypothetical protein